MNQLTEQSKTLPRYSKETLRKAQARIQWQKIQARPSQLPPETPWQTWLILSGRGWGKTRTGSEWLAYQAITNPKTRWAIVAKTYADVRDTCAEGVSGIVSVLNRYQAIKTYNRSIGEITLTNGSKIKLFSAEEPDRLRGPQHHGAWLDELAAWEKPDAYDQLQFGLRLGDTPQVVITTTPRPTKIIKDLISRETTYVTRGSTFENSDNLSQSALVEMQNRYSGTRLGRQELFGEILDDNPGALWNRAQIESSRVTQEPPSFTRVVIGIDPAVTSGEDSDFTGIITAGMTGDGHYYILADDTLKASPDAWARKAINAFELHKADRIIAETNNGGDLVVHLLQQVNPNVPVKKVTATRGKAVRAEPIASLYEQGRVHHVGYFADLETEMCEWEPGVSLKSPDRMDALVWALTELSEGSATMTALAAMAVFCPNCKMPAPKSSRVCPRCGSVIGDSDASAINKSNA
jgi:phage terminase large subunit-like protein